jgi:hypothetical protein
MDPITTMATASAAFKALKSGFMVGRDIEQMAGDLSRWMGALSDLEQAEKEAKNPPIFKKMFAGKTVEQEALEVFTAKRKAQEQRDELKSWISLTLGPKAWQDLVATEGKIRKQRQETIYKQREKRRKFIEITSLSILACIGALLLYFFVMFLKGLDARASETIPDYVNCRLVGCEIIDGSRVCIYRGPNNTQEVVYMDTSEWFPQELMCKYEPNKVKPPTIRDTLDAIKKAME